MIKDGLQIIGFDTLARLKGDTSALYLTAAAFPSIHAAFPTIGVIVARRYRMPGWVQAVLITHLCVIWFTIVYTGEHYVIDIVGGVAFAFAAWWIVQKVSARIGVPLARIEPAPEPVAVPGRRGPPGRVSRVGRGLRARGYTDGVPEKTYLITPGPTPVPPEVQAAMARPLIHHRSPDFKRLFAETLAGLKRVFMTGNDVLVIPGSGTYAMESAVANMVSPGDRVLVASAGNFGQRWQKLVTAYGARHGAGRAAMGRAARSRRASGRPPPAAASPS